MTVSGRGKDAVRPVGPKQASQQSEAALEQAQKLARLGYYRWSKVNRRLLGCNDEYLHILGLSPGQDPETLAGMQQYLHPADRNRVIRAHLAAEAAGRGVQLEFRIVRPNGEIRHLRDLNEPEPNPDGPPEVWFGTVQDISDLKEGEAALRESEERYRSVVAALSEGIVLQAADGTIRASNASAERILGLTPAQMSGRTSLDPRWRALHEDGTAFPGDSHPSMVTLRTGQPCHGVVMGVLKPDGTLSWISIDSQPLVRPGESKPYAVVASFTDITERKLREAELAEARGRLTDAVRKAKLAYWRQDVVAPGGPSVYAWEEAAEVIFGVPIRDLPTDYEHYREWVHPEDAERLAERYRETETTAQSYQREYRIIRPDGKTVWVHELGEVEKQEGDTPLSYVGTLQDITERKAAEATLRESEERFRTLVEQAPEAVLVFDVDSGRFILANRRAEELFGCDRQELLRAGPSRFYAPGQPDERPAEETFAEHNRRVLAGETVFFERRIRNALGEERVCEVRLAPLPSSEGRLMRASFIDITQRKLASLALQRLTRTLRTLSRAKRALIRASDERTLYRDMCQVIVETGGYRMAWIGLLENDPAKPVRPVAEAGHVAGYLDAASISWADSELGRGPTGLAARTGLSQVNGDFACNPAVAPWRDRALERGYRSSIALPLADAGSVFGVLTIYASELNAFGPDEIEQLTELSSDLCYGVRGLRLAAAHEREIEERRILEQRLQQTQKMEAIGQLASGVAHDFNNLLTIISGFSDTLLEKLPQRDPLRELVTPIAEAGERGAALTGQLLALGQRSMLEPRIVHLNSIVANVQKMLARLIGENIRLVMSLDAGANHVKVDPGHLEQVLINLAINSRDAMPDGGRLTIETANVALDEARVAGRSGVSPGNYVKLSVTDTGIGMTPQIRARVFEPFFTTKGTGKGTGLGLAIVHGIVKQSGGFVDVYSEPGVGTTFNVYMPAVEAGAADGEGLRPHSEAESSLKGIETVLLVDDEEDILRLGRLVLESKGYKVIAARDGAEAMRAAAAHEGPLDILVTDVVMPGMGGRQLAEALRARDPQLKVLFASGYPEDAIVRHGILQAEVAFLRKPYSRLGLLRKLREVLDAPPQAEG